MEQWDEPGTASGLRAAVAPLRRRGRLVHRGTVGRERRRRPPDGLGRPARCGDLRSPGRRRGAAARGRLLRPILTEQVPRALRMAPDLVSIVGGGNDMLRPAVDPDVLARNLEAAVVKARAAGADVILATGMDAKDSPVVRRTRSR